MSVARTAMEQVRLPDIQSVRTLTRFLREIDAVEEKRKAGVDAREQELKRTLEKIGELKHKGHQAVLVKPLSQQELEQARKAIAFAAEKHVNEAQLKQLLDTSPDFAELAVNPQNYIHAIFLLGSSWPPMEVGDYMKKYAALEHRVIEQKTEFIILSIDDAGKPSGAAALAYLPRTNTLLVSDIAVKEEKIRSGVDAFIMEKALEIAGIKAQDAGKEDVEFVAAEARIPSGSISPQENQATLTRLAILANNDVQPASQFEYARRIEFAETRPQKKIVVPRTTERISTPATPERRAEKQVEELRTLLQKIEEERGKEKEAELEEEAVLEKIPSQQELSILLKKIEAKKIEARPQALLPTPLALCIRLLKKAKISSKKLEEIAGDVRGYCGEKPGEEIEESGKAPVRFITLDAKKMLLLAKLVGLAALPPPKDEGPEQ